MSQLGDDVALAFREAVAQRERAEKAEAELARVTAEAAELRSALQVVADFKTFGYFHDQVQYLVDNAREVISSTSAGAGLLKRLEASEAVCEAAADIRCQVGDDMGKPWTRFIYALRDWKRARGSYE